MPDPIQINRRPIARLTNHGIETLEDSLVIEEPLEITVEQQQPTHLEKESIYVTMRTPGNDLDLAMGFLYSEGFIQSIDDLEKVDYCGPKLPPYDIHNIVKARIAPGVSWRNQREKRQTQGNSSCGLCGITTLKAVRLGIKEIPSGFHLSTETLLKLEASLKNRQPTFNATGGIHAVSLFDAEGQWIVTMEDVGRHNAMDKVIGYCLRNKLLPLHNHCIVTTSRASFELVQKSGRAGCALLAAVSAPSSLAVQLADDIGQTLVGFLRPGRFNLYTDRKQRLGDMTAD